MFSDWLCERGEAGLICTTIGVSPDIRNTNQGTNVDAFHSRVSSNLSGNEKPARMVILSVVSSQSFRFSSWEGEVGSRYQTRSTLKRKRLSRTMRHDKEADRKAESGLQVANPCKQLDISMARTFRTSADFPSALAYCDLLGT